MTNGEQARRFQDRGGDPRTVFFLRDSGAAFPKPGIREKRTFRGLFPGIFLFAVFFAAGFSTCSSAPEKPEEVFTDRNMATNQLNLANLTASRGRYEDAMLIAEDAWRLALTTDDPPLRIKTAISRGNILFSLGRHDEAFETWERAAAEGDESNETVLAALSRIYAIRAGLLLLGYDNPAGGGASAAEEYKSRLLKEMDAVKSDPLSGAAANVTLGMAEKQQGNWAEAENAVRNALEVHEKNLALEDAAYDWFVIASIRSLAGNYDASLEALKTAIQFDRRAENGFGLAASWKAAGEVYEKAGRREEALAAFRRSADIYRALGLNARAEELEKAL